MAAEKPATEGVEPPAPASVKQELPSLNAARQNFREKVQAFVKEVKIHEDHPEKGPTSDAYHKLQGFLDNSVLPKRNQEKEIINAMTLLASQLETKKRVVDHMEATKLKEMSEKFKGIIKEAKTAEEEFDQAYEEDKKQTRTPPTPGFVVGTEGALYNYSETNEKTGEKIFGVMSTNNTREGFKDALNYYANSKDEAGNSRQFTNVNFGKPSVSAQQLKESSGLRKNFFNQICDALDANLYPEKEIQKYLEANAGPNMNSRGSYFTDKPNVFSKVFGYETEKEVKDQEKATLLKKIESFKNRRDGVQEKEGLAQGSVNASKKQESVSLSLNQTEKAKEAAKETANETAPAPKAGSRP